MDSNFTAELCQLLEGFTVSFHSYIDRMHLRLADVDNHIRAMEHGRVPRDHGRLDEMDLRLTDINIRIRALEQGLHRASTTPPSPRSKQAQPPGAPWMEAPTPQEPSTISTSVHQPSLSIHR